MWLVDANIILISLLKGQAFFEDQAPSRVPGMLSSPDIIADTSWYLDSGATNHLTPYHVNLMTSSEF